MKSFAAALAALAVLCAALGASAGSAASSNATAKTSIVVGTIKAIKDKSGDKVLAVAVKTEAGTVLVPSASIEQFAPYDGRTMRICCAVQDKTLIPLCVMNVKAPPADKKF